MSYVYRFTDLARWGIGKNARLSSAEGDDNTWYTDQRLVSLEARPLAQPAIVSLTISGEMMYMNFADSTSIGPYKLPVAQYTSPGDGVWAPFTHYGVLDTFSINGGLYVTEIDHTSAATFDPGANDGAGHDYYRLMFQAPGASLPTGGETGQILVRTTHGVDYAVTWRWVFPSGAGNAGKFLQQKSSTQDDVEFVVPEASEIHYTPPTSGRLEDGPVDSVLEALASGAPIDASGIPFTPVSGSGITADNVEDAINQVSSGGGIGRQTMWIPAGAMSPLLTDGAEPNIIETSFHKNLIKTLDFDPDNDEGVQFEITMPKSWDRTDLVFKIFWSHATTSSVFTVEWQVYANTLAHGDDFDVSISNDVRWPDTGGTADTMNVTAESDPLEIINAVSGLQPAFGETLYVQVWRNAGNPADTLTIDARLHGMHIYYNTTAATDN